jgi:hypothetical protein
MRRGAEDRLDGWFAYLNETVSTRTGGKYARNTLVSAYNAVLLEERICLRKPDRWTT